MCYTEDCFEMGYGHLRKRDCRVHHQLICTKEKYRRLREFLRWLHFTERHCRLETCKRNRQCLLLGQRLIEKIPAYAQAALRAARIQCAVVTSASARSEKERAEEQRDFSESHVSMVSSYNKICTLANTVRPKPQPSAVRVWIMVPLSPAAGTPASPGHGFA